MLFGSFPSGTTVLRVIVTHIILLEALLAWLLGVPLRGKGVSWRPPVGRDRVELAADDKTVRDGLEDRP
ncbi:MAG: hypothetical protein AB7I50_05910 [Vicinamibacterales bacterium]